MILYDETVHVIITVQRLLNVQSHNWVNLFHLDANADENRPRSVEDLAQNLSVMTHKLQETITHLSILENHDMSDLFIFFFTDNESVVSSSIISSSIISSSICGTSENQKQSHDDLTNLHRRRTTYLSKVVNLYI